MSSARAIPVPGETFRCAECGRESIAKLQKVMDGWRCLGETVVCAFCKAPVAPPVSGAAPSAAAGKAAAAVPERAALDRLASFLDARPEARPTFKDKDKGRFCKDCRHYFKHPFYSHCLYHDRHVEPMDDCDDYAPRATAAAPDASESETK